MTKPKSAETTSERESRGIMHGVRMTLLYDPDANGNTDRPDQLSDQAEEEIADFLAERGLFGAWEITTLDDDSLHVEPCVHCKCVKSDAHRPAHPPMAGDREAFEKALDEYAEAVQYVSVSHGDKYGIEWRDEARAAVLALFDHARAEGNERAVIAAFQRWSDMHERCDEGTTEANESACWDLEQEAWETLKQYRALTPKPSVVIEPVATKPSDR